VLCTRLMNAQLQKLIKLEEMERFTNRILSNTDGKGQM
jgi:hypothetical protein